MKLFHKSKLSVHIVEQHNDVVPFIHRAIASKQLPFSGIPIIHLDSHPDLLIPIHLDADTVFQPQELYEALSIENWVLPMCYAKHIDHVIWVRPPWANQIRTSEQSFSIGKCCHTGKLRLSCKENYFLTDGLFRSPDNLEKAAECRLTVVELRPNNWKDLDPQSESMLPSRRVSTSETISLESESPESSQTKADGRVSNTDGTASNAKVADDTISNTKSEDRDEMSTNSTKTDKRDGVFDNYEKWTSYLQDIVTTKPYILDVDLDFFSTTNPFTQEFESEKELLQRVFKCPVLTGSSDEEVSNFTSLREKQLQQLENFFTALNDKWCEDDAWDISMEKISEMSLVDLTDLDSEDLDYFHSDMQEDLKSLCHSMLPEMKQREISFLQLFDFGCTLDDTDLPHHISTDAQIEALGSAFRSSLTNLPKPAIVTISRSSHDDYCPKDQVEKVQTMVLKILTDIYGALHVTDNFDE